MGYVMYLKMYIMYFWSVVYILFSHFGKERITHEDILVKGLHLHCHLADAFIQSDLQLGST